MKMSGFGAGIIPSVCFSGALSPGQVEIGLIFRRIRNSIDNTWHSALSSFKPKTDF